MRSPKVREEFVKLPVERDWDPRGSLAKGSCDLQNLRTPEAIRTFAEGFEIHLTVELGKLALGKLEGAPGAGGAPGDNLTSPPGNSCR